MLRIVGLQRSDCPEREFVLLQNQGSLKVRLRGHVLLSERAVGSGDLTSAAHVFQDDVQVPAGLYVLLTTGCGSPHWSRTRDGMYVYQCFMGQDSAFWQNLAGPVHVMGPLHTFAERGEALRLR